MAECAMAKEAEKYSKKYNRDHAVKVRFCIKREFKKLNGFLFQRTQAQFWVQQLSTYVTLSK